MVTYKIKCEIFTIVLGTASRATTAAARS